MKSYFVLNNQRFNSEEFLSSLVTIFIIPVLNFQGKWLLVNIQRDEDFNCHLANRDLWSRDNIKEIVSCVFLFWQVQNISIDGEEFCKM